MEKMRPSPFEQLGIVKVSSIAVDNGGGHKSRAKFKREVIQMNGYSVQAALSSLLEFLKK